MRLRLPELLKEHNITAYGLAQLTHFPATSMYRLVRAKGRLSLISGHLVEQIAKVLHVGLLDILELEGTAKKVVRKRAKKWVR